MEAKSVPMAEWGIASKVWCTLLCTHTQSCCEEAFDQIPAVGSEARKIVGLFRSTQGLVEMLEGQTSTQEVETRWSSTFDMLQQLHDQHSQLAALSNLNSDISPLNMESFMNA